MKQFARLSSFEMREIARKYAVAYWGAGTPDKKLETAIIAAITHAERVLLEKQPEQPEQQNPKPANTETETLSASCPRCGSSMRFSRSSGATQGIDSRTWNEMWSSLDKVMDALGRLFK